MRGNYSSHINQSDDDGNVDFGSLNLDATEEGLDDKDPEDDDEEEDDDEDY